MLTTRQVHEEKRKRSKAEWKLAREGYHEAVLDLKNTEDRYRHYLSEFYFNNYPRSPTLPITLASLESCADYHCFAI